MSELSAAWDLARAINTLDALKAFSINAANTEMDLQWGCGSATSGYQELRKAIAEVVSEQWGSLRAEAIRRAEWQLKEARARMHSALNGSAPAEKP